jgi:5'-nucleotidase (lipoprotein e(P4) family)
MNGRFALPTAFLLIGCATIDQPSQPSQSLTSNIAAIDAEGAPQRASVPPTTPPSPFATLQWLYGSGEGAATSIQAYRVFRDFVLSTIRARPRDSVVLAESATLANPGFVPCGDRPFAVILDVDETAIQNLGYQYDRDVQGIGFEETSWERWERTGTDKIAPMPGAVDAIRAIRDGGVAVIYNSNRLSANAAFSERALNDAELGPVQHRRTLWLMGDVGDGSRKDPRRAVISQTYCVIAMAGDQLGDFSDLFRPAGPQRRAAAASAPFARLWGSGWFMLSNPVYGPAMAGTREEVFPPEVRWSDPATTNR